MPDVRPRRIILPPRLARDSEAFLANSNPTCECFRLSAAAIATRLAFTFFVPSHSTSLERENPGNARHCRMDDSPSHILGMVPHLPRHRTPKVWHLVKPLHTQTGMTTQFSRASVMLCKAWVTANGCRQPCYTRTTQGIHDETVHAWRGSVLSLVSRGQGKAHSAQVATLVRNRRTDTFVPGVLR